MKRKTGVRSTEKNEKCKTQKGITLIALVITIIVLLILAGVGINMAISSEGLFAHANKAVTEWNKGVAKEGEMIENILTKANEMENGGSTTPHDSNKIYARLYTDGTLILSSSDYKDPTKEIEEDYGDISEKDDPGWLYVVNEHYEEVTRNKASNVIIYDKIKPKNTSCWFEAYTRKYNRFNQFRYKQCN